MHIQPPQSIDELWQRAQALKGLSLQDLAAQQQFVLPSDFQHHKGWLGQFIERVLGATAGSSAQPDFPELGVELKTIPVNASGKPKESTFVCAVSYPIASDWQSSLVYCKLRQVLWLPVYADAAIPQRQIGQAVLWQPNRQQQQILQQDWQELTEMLLFGEADQLTADYGQALQIRPKAANSRVLRATINAEAEHSVMVPRGFYLRTAFTRSLLN